MLLETDNSIAEIALAAGFCSPAHLAHVFQKDLQPVLQNSYLADKINISNANLLNLVLDFKRENNQQLQNIDYTYKTEHSGRKILNIDETILR